MFLLLVGLTSCGGGDGSGTTQPDPPRATTITITQNSVTLSFLGATLTLTATVRDQNGAPMSGTITWSSSDASVVTVAATGLVTAIQNGTTTVTATSGSLSATVTATVEQIATVIAVISGDGQTATVGQALTEALVVRADDAGGTAVVGVDLAFAVTSGGGTVGSSTATSDAQGLASTTWTLGTTAGLQQVDVSIAGSTSSLAQISATGLAGTATGFVQSSGDLQTSAINLALPLPIATQFQDQFGNGVEGGEVTFTVTAGGGSVNPATVTTDEDGIAQTTWTMGPAVGPGTLTAVVTGFPVVEFTANALLATPDLVAGTLSFSPPNPTTQEMVTVTVPITNNGTGSTGVAFPVQLLVDGVDAASPRLGALTSSSTQTIGPLAPSETMNAEFTVGPLGSGTRSLSIVVDPANVIAESDETNNTAVRPLAVVTQAALTEASPIPNVGGTCSIPPPGNCATSGGQELLFAFQYAVADGLSIEINLSGGINDADMYVNHGSRPEVRDDYECISGEFDSNESCRFEGAETGIYHILIHAFETFSGTTLSVTTGLDVLPFNIELVFLNSGSASQNAAFTAAAARWESIIPFDIIDIPFLNQPIEANSACGTGEGTLQHPPIEDTVDDLRIFVDISSIDGAGGTLGQAGPCIIRSASGLPVIGTMQFDIDDLSNLEAAGRLLPVILHEMAHVLGIGTVWGRNNLLRNPSVPPAGTPGADTHFVGPLAIEAFDDAGGTSYTGGEKVPVENSGEPGSGDGHWRESLFGFELMTPIINNGPNPLSAISIQSLADVGYRVDLGPADPYSRVFTAAAPALEKGPVIDLRDDIRRGPIFEVDDQGRVVRVINR